MCGEAYWIAYYYYFFFFSNICDCIKEGSVLLLLFPSPLSLPFDWTFNNMECVSVVLFCLF